MVSEVHNKIQFHGIKLNSMHFTSNNSANVECSIYEIIAVIVTNRVGYFVCRVVYSFGRQTENEFK
jgi:hypothetical protein